ncbi:myosin ie [Moniliophthora roreri MCA 2997]|uniref:Myosin ie n=2 Tax=Moniliophthora roreri TaxID=221103 RepID=V2X4R2_MONRO|nr:myosin ie [Moniliophthora roreri MCA 2997]KAI3604537.1 myosin ie [Moniliophthora roreri]
MTVTTMSSDTQKAALLSHVVSQIEQNVEFLISQNYLSRSDASAFLNKLSNVNADTTVTTTTTMPLPTPFAKRTATAPAHAASASQLPTCRALWGYNENGADTDDLSFSAGDIIEIVEETNADWWMGRVNGKQALFPSSYVEKIQAAPTSAPAPAPAARALPPFIRNANTSEKPAYKPFGAAHSSVNQPPPPGAGTNGVGLQQDVAGQEKKKSKFAPYGNTLAHSAAGGVGFGAGSAIGGGLVRAIF